jgi:guanylate kinase
MSSERGQVYVISAPSGTGKTSLVKALLERNPAAQVCVSHTTRKIRPGEVDGLNYFFINRQAFKKMLADDQFIESAEVFGHLYGTSKREANRILSSGRHIILEIDWQGAVQVKASMPESQMIFILPPSLAALRQRLVNRNQDDPDTVERRLTGAIEEIKHHHRFDFLLVNDIFDTTLQALEQIISSDGSTFKLDAQLTHLAPLINQLLLEPLN